MATLKSARSQATLWGAIGLVGIVVMLALVLIVFPGKKDKDAGPAPAPSGDAGCNVPVGDTSSTPKIPDDLDWEAANGWTWPVSPSLGPTEETEDGRGICFAHSPLGAALAMTNIMAAYSTATDPAAVAEQYVVDGPGKTAQLAVLKKSEGSAAQQPMRFVGFSVGAFSADRAQVTVVVEVPSSPTGLRGFPMTLRWVDGDWRWELLDDGRFFPGAPTAPQTEEVVMWAGSDG